jgi:hypothetical protein
MKIEITVMPAWMAGIQARKDASGNVHVNLDSGAPCWNDVREVLQLPETPPNRIFNEAHEDPGAKPQRAPRKIKGTHDWNEEPTFGKNVEP